MHQSLLAMPLACKQSRTTNYYHRLMKSNSRNVVLLCVRIALRSLAIHLICSGCLIRVITIIIKVNYNYRKKISQNPLRQFFKTLTNLYVKDCQTTRR